MTIKTIVVLLVALALASFHLAEAQQPRKVYRVGVLSGQFSGPSRDLEAFRQRLRDLGYIEGKNLIIEYRYANGRYDRLSELASELVRLKVDVITTSGTATAVAAKKATSTIPIVMASSTDPVGRGLIASLALFAFRRSQRFLATQALTVTASVYVCAIMVCLWELLR